MKYIFSLCLIICSTPAAATLYQCNINSVNIFSQFPCANKSKQLVGTVELKVEEKQRLQKTAKRNISYLSTIEHKQTLQDKKN